MEEREILNSHSQIGWNGGIGVRSDRFGEIQLAALGSDGSAELLQIGFPYMVGPVQPEVTKGLRMTGVMRRSRIFRRFTEAGPAEVREGDKVVLEGEDGEHITPKVNKVF